jgi:hypothetical protein
MYLVASGYCESALSIFHGTWRVPLTLSIRYIVYLERITNNKVFPVFFFFAWWPPLLFLVRNFACL